MALIPENVEGKEVELTEEQRLMQLKKTELIELIEAQNLKYKKLLTKNKNTNKELSETNGSIEEAADTILKLTEAVELANDEAAQLSNSLLTKNRQAKEVNEIVVDMIQGVDLTLRNAMKLLEMNGIFAQGGSK